MIRRIRTGWAAIHRDEQGLNTLQVVAILAVAAIVLAVIKLFWADIFNWFVKNAGDTSTGWEGSAE